MVTWLDTNVLVRYLTQDDPRQAALASQPIEDKLRLIVAELPPAAITRSPSIARPQRTPA